MLAEGKWVRLSEVYEVINSDKDYCARPQSGADFVAYHTSDVVAGIFCGCDPGEGT